MTEPRSKAALLELIERERGLWDDMVAEIGEDRIFLPGATGEWNFKEVVAHLNGWRINTWSVVLVTNKKAASRRGFGTVKRKVKIWHNTIVLE
jgi:hypothetical protein